MISSPAKLTKCGYAYDAAGNLNRRTNNALVQTFTVNNLNQLSNATRSGTLTAAGTTTSPATNVTVNTLTADRYADRTFARTNLSLSDGNNTFTAIAWDNLARLDTNAITVNLPATLTFLYDQNGNLRTNGSVVMAYDDENQLIAITNAGAWASTFTYDGKMRRRIEKNYRWTDSAWQQTNEARFVYDANVILQERDGFNLPRVTLTRGLDPSGTFQGAGGIGGILSLTEHSAGSFEYSYFHADGNGNVTALVNSNQQVVARYLYDPFGNTLSATGPKAASNRYRFSSKPIHELSGMSDYLYRWYVPELQRWLNRDPIEEEGGINLFAFVYNDSVNDIDPTGENALLRKLLEKLFPKFPPKKNPPKPTPKFKQPTNPPQLPPDPSKLPPGTRCFRGKPTQQYTDGYWKIEKFDGKGWQRLDPRTMKPGPHQDTHVPMPPGYKGPFDN